MLNRTFTSRIALALTAPAFALAAIAAPSGWSATAAAQPVNPAHQTSAATAVRVLNSATASTTEAISAPRFGHSYGLASYQRHHHRYSAKRIAWLMMHRFGWRPRYQFRYLNWLWERESSWNVYATNPYSGAYGIPQAVPGGKMASAGRNWRTSARTQIRWGLGYIKSRYGSPANAWAHECDYGWY